MAVPEPDKTTAPETAPVTQLWARSDESQAPTLENHLGGDEARNYRRYEFDTVSPHVGKSLLEVGSGLGHFASQFLDRVSPLIVSDADPYCLEQLNERFAGRADVEVLDFMLPDPVPTESRVDTVVAMNVLEHVEDDVAALRSLANVVLPGGRIVLWVPGYMQLYGDFDRKVGHVRRYTPRTLGASVQAAGLDIEVLRPINMLGGMAWWLAVRKGGTGYPNPRLVKVYDRVVIPVTRVLDKLFRPPFGQTVFCVARVPGEGSGNQ